MLKKVVSVLFLLTTIPTAQAGAFSPSIQAAHDAYVKGDGAALLREIKTALMAEKNHPLVVAHLAGLYASAERNGILKDPQVDWKLPKEVEYLKVEAQRRYFTESGRVRFFLDVTGTLSPKNALEQLQIIRFPDQVVIDKQAKVGEWSDQPWHDQPSFWGSTDRSNQPVQEGLYLLNVKLANQPMVQGWFLLANANSSASPVVTAPLLSQALAESRPLFRWNEFHSPEFQSDEIRRIHFKISRNAGDDEAEVAGGSLDGVTTAFLMGDIGHVKDYTGAVQLTPGSYQFSVTYIEKHKFGDLDIGRASSTKVPFSVR